VQRPPKYALAETICISWATPHHHSSISCHHSALSWHWWLISLPLIDDVVELVMEVDVEAGLRPGARLTVNTLAVSDPEDQPINHDDAMEELTGKMYVIHLSFSFSFTLMRTVIRWVEKKGEWKLIITRLSCRCSLNVCWLLDSLPDWQIDRATDQLIDWLANLSTDLLTYLLTNLFILFMNCLID